MALPDGVTLVDAFPFDSNPELITDVNGYLAGDRSVDAWTMQNVFKQFFSDGVFGTPADALQIKKGASGLTVTIEPGMFIIHGGMGGIKEDAGALTLTLDTQAAAGNVCYGIMLRYDNNPDMRGLGFRVVKGVASGNPVPPAPDTTSVGVKELRLGYVTVLNGATDLANAIVVNEKGSSVCPYAAPFAEIDLSDVTEDARNSAYEALSMLLEYFESYRDMVDAAIDDTEAGYLQEQITALQQQLQNFDLSGSVDDQTIEYAIKQGEVTPKLRVKSGGIEKGNLSHWLQMELGITDTTDWTYDDYKQAAQQAVGDQDKQDDLLGMLDSSTVVAWTDAQIAEFSGYLTATSQVTYVGYVTSTRATQMAIQYTKEMASELSGSALSTYRGYYSLANVPWANVRYMVDCFGSDWAADNMGRQKSVTATGFDPCLVRLVGFGKDGANSLTFYYTQVPYKTFSTNNHPSASNYTKTNDMKTWIEQKYLPAIDADVKGGMIAVTKKCSVGGRANSAPSVEGTFTVFPASYAEIGGETAEGYTTYDYFVSNPTKDARRVQVVGKYGSPTYQDVMLRDGATEYNFNYLELDGDIGHSFSASTDGVTMVFVIGADAV